MLRKVLDFLVNVWARLHARQVVKTDAEIVKVNVGSGLQPWINLMAASMRRRQMAQLYSARLVSSVGLTTLVLI